jgi:hypothetical protein
MNEEWMNKEWDETTLTGDVVCYNLRAAIFAAYADRVRRERREGPPTGPYNSEHARRKSALLGMQNILDQPGLGLPVNSQEPAELARFPSLPLFSAIQLELLEMMMAYWREVEVAEDAEINAPEPDLVQ